MPDLIVEDWHTECGACGYGAGGWMESPRDGGNPILSPESRACPRSASRSREWSMSRPARCRTRRWTKRR